MASQDDPDVGELEAEANEANADHVGGASLIEKIQGGWLEFDLVIASPDQLGMMRKIAEEVLPHVKREVPVKAA